jgi:hypothetical protein
MTTEKPYLSVAELAALATQRGRHIAVQHLRYFIRAGQLPARRVSGVWVINRIAAMQWLEQWLSDKP